MVTKHRDNTILIREARVQDLEQVQRLGSHVYSTTFGHSLPSSDLQLYLDEFRSLDAIKQDFADPHKDFIVATDLEGIIVGFALLTQATSEPCIDHVDSKVELQRLYVAIEHHGRGIGKLLARRLDEVARTKGFRYVWLGVWEENYKAQKVYRSLGYEKVGDHDFTMGNVVQNDWIMMKEL